MRQGPTAWAIHVGPSRHALSCNRGDPSEPLATRPRRKWLCSATSHDATLLHSGRATRDGVCATELASDPALCGPLTKATLLTLEITGVNLPPAKPPAPPTHREWLCLYGRCTRLTIRRIFHREVSFHLPPASCLRSQSKRVIVSTSEDTSCGFCKNTSAPTRYAAISA